MSGMKRILICFLCLLLFWGGEAEGRKKEKLLAFAYSI